MSEAIRVATALEWTAGRLRQGDPSASFRGVSIDSRRLGRDELFVAIRGERHDGHAFVAQAVARGAAALVVERGHPLPSLPATVAVIEVDDSTRALAALASGHRAGFTGPVIAITGSSGKTTTKEMCAAILGETRACLKNEGNLNNRYGLPLTLLRRERRHEVVVVELGTNHPGEIAELCAIARPTVGVITNVGPAHIENFGSIDAIAKEKGDLFAALDAGGVAIFDAEDPRAAAQAERTRARRLSFGFAPQADVRAERTVPLGERGFAFEVVTRGERVPVHVLGLGEATVRDALAAAAAALAAGAPLDSIAAGLARFRPIAGRLERVTLPENVILLNDTYNANPQSMEVALRSLARLRGRSRAIAVLGDMGELGEHAPIAHREAGRLAAELGLDFLIGLGEHAHELAAGAREAGMDPARIRVAGDPEEAARLVRGVVRGSDWVLVKGSRAARMERVVEALAREHAAGAF